MRLPFVVLLVALLFIPHSSALSVSASGTCRDFDVTVRHGEPGCWDVKIDAPAQVLHRNGWKDSFFYVQNALCSGDAVLRIKFDRKDNITAAVKIRQDSRMLQQPLEIVQNCTAVPVDIFFSVVLFVAAILLALVWWEARRKKR